VPAYAFDEKFDHFAFNSLLTREESIVALGKVITECNKVSAMSVFQVPVTKSMKLEEFEQTQAQVSSQVGYQMERALTFSCRNWMFAKLCKKATMF